MRVSGLGRSTEAAGGAASVEVSDRFTVVPASALCSAGPAGAVVTPGEGNRRTVAVDVGTGDTVTVTVKCTNRTQTDQATAKFAVTSAVGCNVDLGGFAPGTATVHGTISADGGCTSRRRAWSTSGTYHAKRHILRLDSAGWVSVTLESAAAYPDGFDPFLVILAGDADDGSGTRLAANNNHRGSGGLHWRDSRIADRFMPAGTYSIEATTRHRHDPDRPARTTGAYTLTVTVDQTPRADSQPKRLGTEVGAKLAQTWRYQPGVATAHISTALPEGITAAIYAGDGFATLIAKTTRTGTYHIDITYTNETATHTATTTITATCPTDRVETESRTCRPRRSTLPAGCTAMPLQGGNYWRDIARLTTYAEYGTDPPNACVSLTQNYRAAYYEFEVAADLRALFDLKSVASSGTGTHLYRLGGAPSITLWKSSRDLGGNSVLRFVASAYTSTVPGSSPRLIKKLDAGSYVLEVANSMPVRTNGRVTLRPALPLASEFGDDVKNVGNTGLSDAGMTLGQFLAARGTTDYGNHPDTNRRTVLSDPHDPESPTFPWLAFWTDKCSVPDSLSAAAAAFNLEDYPVFGDVEVPFIYGCMRHDFNWRNLYRSEHYYGNADDSRSGHWRRSTMREANGRLGLDLHQLCNVRGASLHPDPGSILFTWDILQGNPLRMPYVDSCKATAEVFKFAVGLVEIAFESVWYPPH